MVCSFRGMSSLKAEVDRSSLLVCFKPLSWRRPSVSLWPMNRAKGVRIFAEVRSLSMILDDLLSSDSAAV